MLLICWRKCICCALNFVFGIEMCRVHPHWNCHLLLVLWKSCKNLLVSHSYVSKDLLKMINRWYSCNFLLNHAHLLRTEMKLHHTQFRRRVTQTSKRCLVKTRYLGPMEPPFKKTQVVLHLAVGLLPILLHFWYVEKIIWKTNGRYPFSSNTISENKIGNLR